MAKATQSGKGSVITARGAKFFAGPPGILGMNHLVDPVDPFGDGMRFEVCIHYTDDKLARLGELLDRDVVGAVMPTFEAEARKAAKAAPSGGWVAPVGHVWVEEHTKQPKEGSRQDQPFLQFANGADYKDKDGGIRRKTMKAWSADNQLLDLPALKIGSGSLVQPILQPGLFISSMVRQPQFSLKLQGVRVLKLEQWGGSSSSLDNLTDEDREAMGDTEVDDLSAYLGSTSTRTASPKAAAHHDLDDDLPF